MINEGDMIRVISLDFPLSFTSQDIEDKVELDDVGQVTEIDREDPELTHEVYIDRLYEKVWFNVKQLQKIS